MKERHGKFRKVLACLVALTLVLAVPLTALATGTEGYIPSFPETTAPAADYDIAPIDSGTPVPIANPGQPTRNWMAEWWAWWWWYCYYNNVDFSSWDSTDISNWWFWYGYYNNLFNYTDSSQCPTYWWWFYPYYYNFDFANWSSSDIASWWFWYNYYSNYDSTNCPDSFPFYWWWWWTFSNNNQ